MQLDIIDLESPLEQQIETMGRACETSGFFRIPLSSIPLPIANNAWWMAAEFFALAPNEKQHVAFPEPGYPYGYAAMQTEALARSLGDEAAVPDLKESLSVGPDCGLHVDARSLEEEWIRQPSQWPRRPSGIQASWVAYYRALSTVAEQLMSVMALTLELPADHFAPMIDRPMTSMRAIRYPTVEEVPEGALRAGAHADYGTLTILRTDGVSGLEIQSAGGDWLSVEPRPDTFVVNLGDSIAQWTNDRWRSTVHRVVNHGEPRQSFAFFHMANWDATIECLPTCLGADETPVHEPVQAGPWLMQKFQSTVR
ncbi:MAG: isopenicillin N synthase-like dioxygenase [Candidatus Aldehydirespiratoraceae bacterium]|jgi:isopenicillin N synthase-like dioxygenase